MNDSFSLDGKVIVVTGGTGVLGKSFISCIAEVGGTVGILGRNRKMAEESATRINRCGGKAIALCADVTKRNELNNARKLMLDTYGKIDGLVNAAGGIFHEGIIEDNGDILNLNINGLKKVMDLNLWGTVLPTQVFGEAIIRNGEGVIVNISSLAAKRVISGIMGYGLAKSAVEYFTKGIAVELSRKHGDAIRINAIVPGFFTADQSTKLLSGTKKAIEKHHNEILKRTPFKRLGGCDELNGTLIWLLSRASKFVTGTTVIVDGGFNINSGI